MGGLTLWIHSCGSLSHVIYPSSFPSLIFASIYWILGSAPFNCSTATEALSGGSFPLPGRGYWTKDLPAQFKIRNICLSLDNDPFHWHNCKWRGLCYLVVPADDNLTYLCFNLYSSNCFLCDLLCRQVGLVSKPNDTEQGHLAHSLSNYSQSY